MADVLTPDLCIVGGGSGGLYVAAGARAFDASVVLVEQGKMGGDCLNYGCVPSKAMIAAARHAEAARAGTPFGIAAAEPKVNFGRVHDHVHQIIAGIAPHDFVERFEALGATVLKEHGEFTDRTTLKAGDTLVRARRFVIATGSRPFVPDLPGLADVPYLTNETVFDLRRSPSHLIVIGGGPVGIELSQAIHRLGCEVTLIESGEALSREDPELRNIVLRFIRDEGTDVRENTSVVRVERRGQGVAVTVRRETGDLLSPTEDETITGTHVLVATGRKANIDNLGLEAAGIRTVDGIIRVNRGLRTSNRRVYAIGDVASRVQYTHLSSYHAGLVVRNALFALPVKADPDIVPKVTYTEPEVAQIGVSEATALKKLGGRYKVVRWSFGQNDRARAERQTEGVVKAIFDAKGRLRGAAIAGAHAGELVSMFSLAMANRMKASHLAKFIAPYPTLSEIVRCVGIEYYRDKAANPWLERIRDLVRRLP